MKHPAFRAAAIVIMLSAASGAGAQQLVTLRQCYEGAASKSAIARENDSYSSISSLNDRNLYRGWMPTADLNASALYNSSVADLGSTLGPLLGSLPVPGIADAIKPIPNDQYRITVDVNQMLYDGGAIRSARNMEKAELEVNRKQSESDLYKLRSQVNAWYFSILLLDKQKELMLTYRELVEKRLASVLSAIENGAILRSDGDILRSELLNLGQQISENEIRRSSLAGALADLTGLPIANSALQPEITGFSTASEISRPELQLFDLRIAQLDAGTALVSSKRMPKAFGFATAGYGNPPGNNFFLDKFDTYYIIGAGLKWNIFDWNKAADEKKVITLKKEITENRKKDLEDNIRRQLGIREAEIKNLEKLIATDEEILSLRKKITASAGSQHQNGIITATEYLNIVNAEKQAAINAEIHRINLALAMAEYMTLSGQE